MEVVADLSLEVEGIEATLTGVGDHLVLYSADPAGIVAALPSAAPRSLGRAAELLADAGLRVTFTGPRGPVIELGRGQSSTVGRLITGSRHVRPGSVRALRPLVVSALARRLAVLGRRIGTTGS